MISRLLEQNLHDSLETFPIVGLIGPRQVGKTTLAKALREKWPGKSIYIDLELPSDLMKLSSPELYLRQQADALIILDEIQRIPEIFPLLRALVDDETYRSRFLILGSASPDLLKQSSETLAGRIRYHELHPFTMQELQFDRNQTERLWVRGGYPPSFLQTNDRASLEWRSAFIATYLERDLPQLGVRVPATQLRRFWQMLSHWQGQLWNASKFAENFGVSAPTVRHYLDILTDTFVVRQLHPYYCNVKKRLVKSPKIYIRDTGLLHALLQLTDMEMLFGHPQIGVSWESFVLEQILNMLPGDTEGFFYRTHAGAELDLVLQTPQLGLLAIDVKLSQAPKHSKGFRQAFQDVNADRGYVVMKGDEKFPLEENVWAVPCEKFLEEVIPEAFHL
jgi:predicted AAA+ superfamily ATPase